MSPLTLRSIGAVAGLTQHCISSDSSITAAYASSRLARHGGGNTSAATSAATMRRRRRPAQCRHQGAPQPDPHRQLHPHGCRHGRRPAFPARLLPLRRLPQVALQLHPDRRLPSSARAALLLLPSSPPQRRRRRWRRVVHQARHALLPHDATAPGGVRRHRHPDGPRRPLIRLRPGLPAGVHVLHPNFHAAGLHGRLCAAARAAAVHVVLGERPGAAQRRRRDARDELQRGPSRGGVGCAVRRRVRHDAGRRRAVRTHAARHGAQPGAPRREHRSGGRELRARHGDAVCHRTRSHGLLRRRHVREQRFSRNPKRGTGVRSRRPVGLLPAAGRVGDRVPVLLPGHHRRHLLRLGAARRRRHDRAHPGHRGARRHALPRAVQRHQGRRARSLALGLRLLLLRRGPEGQQGESPVRQGPRRGAVGPVDIYRV